MQKKLFNDSLSKKYIYLQCNSHSHRKQFERQWYIFQNTEARRSRFVYKNNIFSRRSQHKINLFIIYTSVCASEICVQSRPRHMRNSRLLEFPAFDYKKNKLEGTTSKSKAISLAKERQRTTQDIASSLSHSCNNTLESSNSYHSVLYSKHA